MIQSILDWQINHFKSREQPKTKQRNEIKGSTGKNLCAERNRWSKTFSSRKAPIFVGGGIAHGPKGKGYKIEKNK